MKFFRKIGNSIYSPGFYGRVPRERLGTSIGYFFLLILLVTVIRVAVVTGPLVVGVGDVVQSGLADLVNLYPSELRINVEGGQVTTNVKEPYFVPMTATGTGTGRGIKNLLVIDTTTPFSAAQFSQYQSVAWLTRDTLFYRGDDRPDIRALDLSEVGSMQIDRGTIDGVVKSVSPLFGFIGPVIAIGAFVAFYFITTFRLVHLLLLALFVWIIAKVLSKPVGYGASYKIGLYAMTLPLIVELLLDVSRSWLHLGGFPFMFSLLTLAVALVNLLLQRKPDSPALELPTSPSDSPA